MVNAWGCFLYTHWFLTERVQLKNGAFFVNISRINN